MKDYVNAITRNYANFSGRARRREYWMFTLINTVILILLQIPLLGVTAALGATSETGAPPALGGATLVFALLLLLYVLAVLVPSIAVTVRRLHDSGKTGWLYLLNLIPLGSLVVLVFCVMDSEPGTNKWGPNPKGAEAGTPAAANW